MVTWYGTSRVGGAPPKIDYHNPSLRYACNVSLLHHTADVCASCRVMLTTELYGEWVNGDLRWSVVVT